MSSVKQTFLCRCWTKPRTTASVCCRLPPKPCACGSSKWGRWRPFTTHSTSVTLTSHRSVWSLRCGVLSRTWTPFSLLCVEGRWVDVFVWMFGQVVYCHLESTVLQQDFVALLPVIVICYFTLISIDTFHVVLSGLSINTAIWWYIWPGQSDTNTVVRIGER